MDWLTNPLLLRIAFEVVNAISMVEAARMDSFRIRSWTVFLLMVLRRRFFEPKSGSFRGDDDDAIGRFCTQNVRYRETNNSLLLGLGQACS